MFKHIAIEKLTPGTMVRISECELFAGDKDVSVVKFKERLEHELMFLYEDDREYYDEIVADKERFFNRNPIYTLKYDTDTDITPKGLRTILADIGRVVEEGDSRIQEAVNLIHLALRSELKNFKADKDVDYPHLLDSILAKIEKRKSEADPPRKVEKKDEMEVRKKPLYEFPYSGELHEKMRKLQFIIVCSIGHQNGVPKVDFGSALVRLEDGTNADVNFADKAVYHIDPEGKVLGVYAPDVIEDVTYTGNASRAFDEYARYFAKTTGFDTVDCPRCGKKPQIVSMLGGKFYFLCYHTGWKLSHWYKTDPAESVADAVEKWNRLIESGNEGVTGL